MPWLNRQDTDKLAIRISSAANTAEQEVALFEAGHNDMRIVSVRFAHETAITVDSTSGYTMNLVNKGTSGTESQTVASFSSGTPSAGNVSSAFQAIELTPSTVDGALDIEAGEQLSWKETTIGTGTARSNGVVVIESYIL